MAQTFQVPNMPYINGDDKRYGEAIQALITQISALQTLIQSLDARVKALGG